MNAAQAFDQKIRSFLHDQPHSSASKTIRVIESAQNGSTGYYGLFDRMAFKVGLGVLAVPFYNERGKFKGYFPKIVYYPRNPLGEEPRHQKLTANPLGLEACYRVLAKELLYRMMRIEGLKEKLSQQTPIV